MGGRFRGGRGRTSGIAIILDISLLDFGVEVPSSVLWDLAFYARGLPCGGLCERNFVGRCCGCGVMRCVQA